MGNVPSIEIRRGLDQVAPVGRDFDAATHELVGLGAAGRAVLEVIERGQQPVLIAGDCVKLAVVGSAGSGMM
jgi:hypothetical protein